MISTQSGCREYTFEGGLYRRPLDSIDWELNTCTGIIASKGGRVERIESIIQASRDACQSRVIKTNPGTS